MANERGRLYDPDNATTVLLNDSTTKIKILREECDIQGGLVKKPLPFTASSSAIHESVWGRSRIITVEGIKIGTQTEIETFINSIEDWMNHAGLANPWYYYPLFHKDNTASAGSQNQYFKVLADTFNYTAELREVGYILHWTMMLYEGISVRDVIA